MEEQTNPQKEGSPSKLTYLESNGQRAYILGAKEEGKPQMSYPILAMYDIQGNLTQLPELAVTAALQVDNEEGGQWGTVQGDTLPISYHTIH